MIFDRTTCTRCGHPFMRIRGNETVCAACENPDEYKAFLDSQSKEVRLRARRQERAAKQRTREA
jgi:uncharacterized Zn finger protein (UPF0148 family)